MNDKVASGDVPKVENTPAVLMFIAKGSKYLCCAHLLWLARIAQVKKPQTHWSFAAFFEAYYSHPAQNGKSFQFAFFALCPMAKRFSPTPFHQQNSNVRRAVD